MRAGLALAILIGTTLLAFAGGGFETGDFPNYGAIADFNLDGKPDFALTIGSNVGVVLGDGVAGEIDAFIATAAVNHRTTSTDTAGAADTAPKEIALNAEVIALFSDSES